MADIARLTEVIKPEAEALGFELVRVKLTGSDEERVLQIMAEDPATGQLVVEQCMALSRRISAQIDALEEQGDELIVGAYNLEVSSPGIDRPLTRLKDFSQWVGFEARVSLADKVDGKRNLHGILKGVEGDTISIEDRKAGAVEVAFDLVHAAKLVLTNDLIAATKPIDMTGADEVEEIPAEEKADD